MSVAAPAATWSLVLPDGQQVVLRQQGVRLGREQGSCDVLLPSGKVSRSHALVWLDERGQPWVRDLGSANGTAVDGERITERQLRDGSVLALGDVQVRVTRAAPDAAAPPPSPVDRGQTIIGQQGLAFSPATQRWAPAEVLPSASPIFDRDAALPVLNIGHEPAKVEVDEGGGGGGFAKLAVLLGILVLGAIVFFDLSGAKVQKEVDQLLTKSDLVTNRADAKRLAETQHLVETGDLAPKALVVCNSGATPLTIKFLAGATPVANPIPGGHVIALFDSRLPEFNCRNAPVTIAPGGKATVADLRNGWGAACRVPDQAYFLGASGKAGDHDFTRAQLLTNQSACLQLP